METIGSGAHILVFPYPAQGHMIPLLDLTHKLAIRGLTITILVTPKNLSLLDSLLSKHPSIETLVLPFPAHPSIPAGVENAKDLPPDGFRAIMRSLGELYDPLLNWFRKHPSPPVAIISDLFLGWTHKLATELGIVRFVFSPSGAMALSVINYLWRHLPKRDDPNDQNALISLSTIPNSPIYPWWQVSPVYRSYVEGDPVSEFNKDGFVANLSSWGYVINSFTELDRVYIDHLSKDLGHNRVWAIGPVLPIGDVSVGSIERGGSTSESASKIISWLDACQDQTVVYVCFGSQAVLTNDQMEGLSLGLEKSGAKFIWSVKEATKGHVAGEYGTIPYGFEDRVEGRGLVIRGWAPQVAILSHRAVGASLTHVGWNSVIEALVPGVPVLAWPMGADQFVNTTFLVDQLGLALRVCEGAETVPDSDELARVVAQSVGEDQILRVRAMELRKAAMDAVKENGSSFKELDGLASHLSKEVMPKDFNI